MKMTVQKKVIHHQMKIMSVHPFIVYVNWKYFHLATKFFSLYIGLGIFPFLLGLIFECTMLQVHANKTVVPSKRPASVPVTKVSI